jgi:hypothetical protein
MAIAKTLDILLRAPTGKLDKDFKDAQQIASKFFGGIAGLAAAAFGSFTIANFFGSINEGIRRLDELGNRAIRLNVDPTSLLVLERAAVFADTSIQDLEKATVTLVKSIQAGADGSQKQIELFEKLGTTAQELMAMSLPEQLQAISQGMAGIENTTEKTAVAFQVFGKSGRNMLQLMADDGAILAQSLAEVQQYGGVFTSGELARVGATNDAWDRLLLTFNGVFNRIAVDMSPALERLFLNLSDAIKPGTALNMVLIQMGQAATLTVNVIAELAGFVTFLSQESGALGATLLSLVIIMGASVAITKTLTAVSKSYLIIQTALSKVELLRAKLNTATVVTAGVALTAYLAFSKQINEVIAQTLGFADAQNAANSEVGDFIKLQDKASQPIKANLGSASFGSQAALEQLLTVRTERQGIGQVAVAVEKSNDLLGQIRDGLAGAFGVVGGVDFEEVDIP